MAYSVTLFWIRKAYLVYQDSPAVDPEECLPVPIITLFKLLFLNLYVLGLYDDNPVTYLLSIVHNLCIIYASEYHFCSMPLSHPR